MALVPDFDDAKISKLLEDVASHGSSFLSGDISQRHGVISAARNLILALERPSETLSRLTWSEVWLLQLGSYRPGNREMGVSTDNLHVFSLH